MVALNSDFAASKPDANTKNRVGRFFSLAAETVGADSRSSRNRTGEKRGCRYDTTSVNTEFEYGPFGELIRATGEKKNDFNFRFSTKYEDTETGLLYYGYRYYNAETGRWSSRDPIGEEEGLNLYMMIENDAINTWDMLGLYTLSDARKSLEEREVTPAIPATSGHHYFSGPLFFYVPGTPAKYSDQQVFDEWYRLELTRGNWWTTLPKCPRKLCIIKGQSSGTPMAPTGEEWDSPTPDRAANPDPTKWLNPGRPSNAELDLHPETVFSMRSRADGSGHANQCTYDGNGDLLTTPPSAGTVDWFRSGTKTHYNHDVAPVYLANRLDGGERMGVTSSTLLGGPSILGTPGDNLNKYFEVRPLWAE